MMKRISIIIFIALLIGLLLYLFYIDRELSQQLESVSSFNEWVEFVPQSKQFKVLLPSKPQYAKDLLPIQHSDQKKAYQVYASEKIDGSLFLVSIATYPENFQIEKNDEVRGLIRELVNSKIDQQLNQISNSQFKEFEAIDFNISSQDYIAQGKAFMKDKNIYILSYVAQKNNFNLNDYHHFIDSFSIIPK
jgi:hypothetical protein